MYILTCRKLPPPASKHGLRKGVTAIVGYVKRIGVWAPSDLGGGGGAGLGGSGRALTFLPEKN